MWTQQGIHFNTADLDVAYGLKLQKDESKNFLMCMFDDDGLIISYKIAENLNISTIT